MTPPTVKCLVWDLDNTLWDGILLEDREVRLRPEIPAVLDALDARGILHSIASRSSGEEVDARLRAFGIAEYFLHPQVGWGTKSGALRRIADRLNVGLDTLAFIDDDPFERDEVALELPQVLVVDAAQAAAIPHRPEFCPRVVTADARQRRRMYRAEAERSQAEESFAGPRQEFLAGLDLRMRITRATAEDLERAEELTVRTHQLNATGYTYSYQELDAFRTSSEHLLLVAELVDRYGSYGKIGLALVECGGGSWTIKLLLMSCRVMSRGVGAILLGEIMRLARTRGVRLRGEFVPTHRNRAMYVTYRFAGFREIARHGELAILEHPLDQLPPVPEHVHLTTEP
jgi:FkbH-like protein